MLKKIAGLLKNRKGQGLVEYILLICLIALVVGVAIMYFGGYLASIFYAFVAVLTGWCGVCS